MKETVSITVDVHEEDSGILEEIQSRGLEAVQEHMESSDVRLYWKGKSCGLELKRGSDFSNSLKEGRLKDQITRLYDNFDFPMLIVEGYKVYVGDDDTDETVKEKHRKYKMSLRTLNRRITVYEVKNQQETVDIIEEIARDLKNNKLFVIRRPVIVEPELSGALKILCGFPQVSRQRAEDLLDKYGTPEQALHSLDDWPDMKIGLTESRVAEIKQHWGV